MWLLWTLGCGTVHDTPVVPAVEEVRWPSTSTPTDLTARATLALEVSAQVADPAWVCVSAVVDGQPVQVSGEVTLSAGAGEIEVPRGQGCAHVPIGHTGEATVTARWQEREVSEPVVVVGDSPLQTLAGPGDRRVTEVLTDLDTAGPDAERNALFTLLLAPDATVGQLSELLRARDAAIVAATTMGDQVMLSVTLSAPAELGALVEQADQLERPFVEVATPDATLPAELLQPPSADPPRPTTTVFDAPYPEFVPVAEAESVAEGRVLRIAAGSGPKPGPTDVVKLQTRHHTRAEAVVTVVTRTDERPVLDLPAVVRAAVLELGVGGAARVWPRAGTPEIVDVQVLGIAPHQADPTPCDGATEITEMTGLCVFPLDPDPSGVETHAGTPVIVTAKPEGCYSSSGTQQLYSELLLEEAPSRVFRASARVCVAPSPDVLGLHTQDCGGAGVARTAWTLPVAPAVVELGTMRLQVPAWLPPQGVCAGHPPPKRPEPRPAVHTVNNKTEQEVILEAPDGSRYLLPASAGAQVPQGPYALYTDWGAGEAFAGTYPASQGIHELRCLPDRCLCGPAWLMARRGPAGSGDGSQCVPGPTPARHDPLQPVRTGRSDGPWPLVTPERKAALDVRCSVIDPGPRIEGCDEPWRSLAEAWAAAREDVPTRVGEVRHDLEWRAEGVPVWMAGPPHDEGAQAGKPLGELEEQEALPRFGQPRTVTLQHDQQMYNFARTELVCRVRARIDGSGHPEGLVAHGCPTRMAERFLNAIRHQDFTPRGKPWVAVFAVRWPAEGREVEILDLDQLALTPPPQGAPVAERPDAGSWPKADVPPPGSPYRAELPGEPGFGVWVDDGRPLHGHGQTPYTSTPERMPEPLPAPPPGFAGEVLYVADRDGEIGWVAHEVADSHWFFVQTLGGHRPSPVPLWTAFEMRRLPHLDEVDRPVWSASAARFDLPSGEELVRISARPDGRAIVKMPNRLPAGDAWFEVRDQQARLMVVLHGSGSDVLLVSDLVPKRGLVLRQEGAQLADVEALRHQLAVRCPLRGRSETDDCPPPARFPVGHDVESWTSGVHAASAGSIREAGPERVVVHLDDGRDILLPTAALHGLAVQAGQAAVVQWDERKQPGWLAVAGADGRYTLTALAGFPPAPPGPHTRQALLER